jgi:CDI immunity protein
MQNRRLPLKLCGDWDPEFPVQAFFNAISDDALVDIVTHLVKWQGYSSDYCHCRFPADLDPAEPKFEGVRFSHFDDTIVITEGRFADVLTLVCGSYQEADPAGAIAMSELVGEFRQTIGPTDKQKEVET